MKKKKCPSFQVCLRFINFVWTIEPDQPEMLRLSKQDRKNALAEADRLLLAADRNSPEY